LNRALQFPKVICVEVCIPHLFFSQIDRLH
jgi:hypothetical protein